MTIAEHIAMLARMEAARRETHAHLRLIERQIAARAERLMTTFRARSRDYRRSMRSRIWRASARRDSSRCISMRAPL